MDNNAWTRYMRATTHPDNDKTIAKKVGVSPSTIGRWWSGEIDPKPRQVVALAKAYGASPLGALVNAGYVSAEDLDLTITMATDLDAVSTYALLDEIQRRMELMNDFTGWATAIGEGNGSPAVLGEGQLRYVRPGVAPVDVNTEALVDAFDGHVVPLEMYNDEQMYGVVEPTEDGNVRGRQEDYGLVSNESIEEFPGTDDTDYDNA